MGIKKPWGWHLTLYRAKYFKIKLLYFKKWGEISFQKHKHRSETWCVLFGAGWFRWTRRSEKKIMLCNGASRFISKGEWHHFKALRQTLILEIQHGNICEEEDIIRKPLPRKRK